MMHFLNFPKTASVELTYSSVDILNSVLTYCGDLKNGK